LKKDIQRFVSSPIPHRLPLFFICGSYSLLLTSYLSLLFRLSRSPVQMKRVVAALKLRGMYDNTVIAMASDNGGSPADGGNDWPLRGAKRTLFEGGIRVPAFIHSPLLSSEVRGNTFTGLMDVCDWAPTLILGASSLTLDGDRASQFDGFNLWDSLNKAGGVSPRNEVLLNIDYVSRTGGEDAVKNLDDVWMGLIMELHGRQYKVLMQQFDYTYYSPSSNSPWGHQVQANYSDYLFDLTGDPYERHNLLEHYKTSGAKGVDLKSIIATLSERLCHHYDKMNPTQFKGEDSQFKKFLVQVHNDWITWYADYDDSTKPGLGLEDAPTCNAEKLAAILWRSASTDEDDGQFDDDVSLVVNAKSGSSSTSGGEEAVGPHGVENPLSPDAAEVAEEGQEDAEARAEADAAAAEEANEEEEPDAISQLLKRKMKKLNRLNQQHRARSAD